MLPKFDKIKTKEIEDYVIKIIDILGNEKSKRNYAPKFGLEGVVYDCQNKRTYPGFALKIVQINGSESNEKCTNSLRIFYGLPFFRKLVFEKENDNVNIFENGIWTELLEEKYKKALDIENKKNDARKGIDMGLSYPKMGLNF